MCKPNELIVLVVEDDDTIRELMVDLLEPIIHVKTASNVPEGLEALERDQEGNIRIIFCDFNLPKGRTGDEIRQKQLEIRPSAFFTFMSVKVHPALWDTKPDRVIEKPFHIKTIRDIVQDAVKKIQTEVFAS